MADRDFTELARKISAVISLPVSEITPETTIADLYLDSMTAIELVVDLQEDYDIVLSREDFAGAQNLGELAELIWSRLQDTAAAG